MQASKILTAIIAGVATVLIVEIFLRPKFPEIKSAVGAFVTPAVTVL